MPTLSPTDRIGSSIAGTYRLDRILGEGGFGTVYAGVHEWTGRPVAAKIMDARLAQQEPFVSRFLLEARAAAQLSHPNVVDVLDMGREADGTVYLVLELLRGETLAKVLERRPRLELEETLSYLLPVMDALADAHASGVLHRDVKPANIILSVDPRGQMVPKLVDFGVAKDAADPAQTATGSVSGPPPFTSPEQASASPRVGAATDVWSMGAVLFRCLTGQLPFEGAAGAEVLTAQAPPVTSLAPELPPAVGVAIDRALAPEVSGRFADMGELFASLVEAATEAGVSSAQSGEWGQWRSRRSGPTLDGSAEGLAGAGRRGASTTDPGSLTEAVHAAGRVGATVAMVEAPLEEADTRAGAVPPTLAMSAPRTRPIAPASASLAEAKAGPRRRCSSASRPRSWSCSACWRSSCCFSSSV